MTHNSSGNNINKWPKWFGKGPCRYLLLSAVVNALVRCGGSAGEQCAMHSSASGGLPSNDILIGSAVFAQLTRMPNTQTH